jgi:hypothetical protein
MTGDEKVRAVLWTDALTFAVGTPALYWWSGTTPGRPKTVASNAVFLWAPNLPFPRPRRGSWLSCSCDAGHDHCTLSTVDGVHEYSGEYITYGSQTAAIDGQLGIDPKESTKNGVWVGEVLVPLVYLRDGEILIPKDRYDDGAQILDELKPKKRNGGDPNR